MSISKIHSIKSSPIRRLLAPIIFGAAALMPVKTSTGLRNMSKDMFEKATIELVAKAKIESKNVLEITSEMLQDLSPVIEKNFCGGVFNKYDDATVKVLKSRIMRNSADITYDFPIANNRNVYLEKFGMYFADRPSPKGGRPHLGLDIFVSKFSRKPKEPVKITSPIDGVVISQKRARAKDNVIGNSVVLLGVDGRRYGFDHMARATDYNDSIPLPSLGTIMKKGDAIGYVGKTGETSLWHLHLSVMTDEQLAKQSSDKYWIDLSERTPYAPLKGQVNPLSKDEAGPIADLLNQYRH